MKHSVQLGVTVVVLFALLLSTVPYHQHHSRPAAVIESSVNLTDAEMSGTTGGDMTITIYGDGTTWYWVAGGSIIGFALSGATGILPGALIGGLLWAIFG